MTAVALSMRFMLAIMFAGAAIAKMSQLADFEAAVGRYELLPARMVRPISRVIPAAELIAGTALAVGLGTRVAAAIVAVLLAVFSASIAVNLARGRKFDCGCGVAPAPRTISWSLVIQNLVLAAAAAIVAAIAPAVVAVDQLLFGSTYQLGSSELAAAASISILALLAAALFRNALTVWRVLR